MELFEVYIRIPNYLYSSHPTITYDRSGVNNTSSLGKLIHSYYSSVKRFIRALLLQYIYQALRKQQQIKGLNNNSALEQCNVVLHESVLFNTLVLYVWWII